MRAAIVSNHNSNKPKHKTKTTSSLIDQGLFWSQIRKYQLTQTYKKLGPAIVKTNIESNRRNNNNSNTSSSTPNHARKKPTILKHVSTIFNSKKRRQSYFDIEKINQEDPEFHSWEVDNQDKLRSTISLNNKDKCCTCCLHTITFDPQNYKKMIWDFFVAALIFYSVLMIPFVIGFNVEPPTGMVIFNWMVDVTFALDMVLNFFTGYHIEGGSLIKNKCFIATKYLKGWFVIDLFSTVPIDFIAGAVISASGDASSEDLSSQLRALKLIRGLRLLRLLKLARLFKLKKLAAVLDDSDFFHPAMIKVVSLLFKIVFVAHLLACFWFLVGSPESNLEKPYDGWVFQLGVQDETDAVKYSWSFYWTVATMMAVGYGDIYPRTTQEMLYAIVAQTIGALMFGLIIGTVSTVLQTADARGTAIKQKSDEVTEWMRSRKLPKSVRIKIRDHFEYVSHIKSSFRERFILEKLPVSLRSEIEKWSYSDIFLKVPFVGKLSDGFLHELFLMMQPVQLMAGESLWRPGNRCRHLYILRQGLAQHEILRKDLNKWKELPVSIKQKEEIEKVKKEQKEKEEKQEKEEKEEKEEKSKETETKETSISQTKDTTLKVETTPSTALPSTTTATPSKSPSSKYAMPSLDSKKTTSNLDNIYVPLAVYTDGGHFGDERVRPMTENARVLILNVSDFFVLPLDELRHLYMMFTDDALVLQSSAEQRVVNLCKAANVLLNVTSTTQIVSLDASLISDLKKMKSKNMLDSLNNSSSLKNALNKAKENDTEDKDYGALEHQDQLSRSASLQTSSLNVHQKDWMPIVHNGEYCNRGMCSAFWPSIRQVGPSIRFRTVKPNIKEKEWNILAESSERRRRTSLTVMTPTNIGDSDSTVFTTDRDGNKNGYTIKKKEKKNNTNKQQSDASGRIYSYTTVTEEDQNDLWLRKIIYPQRSEKIQWDMLMAVLIVYSVAIIPYRICFSMDAVGFFYFFDRSVDILFAVDMLLTFRTAYFRRMDKIFVTIPTEIASNYFKGWFIIDFLSTFPVDTVVMSIIMSNNDTSGNSKDAAAQIRALKLIRVLRLIRLLKLARLLKLGKFIKSVEEHLQLSPAAFKLLKLVFNVTFIAHLLACFWYYVSSVEEEDERDNWWNSADHLRDNTVEAHYVSSLYWAFTTMTTVGYGDLTPQTGTERTYSIIVMILGATVFGYIVGNVSQMVGQLDVGAARQREQRVEIRNYMKEQDLPREIRMHMDRFFDFYFQRTSIFDESDILRKLPSGLRRTVVMHINKKLLKRFWSFFGRVKNELRCALLMALKPSFCLKYDCLYRKTDGATEMYFVQQGTFELISFENKKFSENEMAFTIEHENEIQKYIAQTEKKEKKENGNETTTESYTSQTNIDASTKQNEGDETEIKSTSTISVGQVFGSVEFVLGSARQDTALALEYCTLMVLPRTSIWSIVAGAPDLASDVQHLLASQLDKETPKKKKGNGGDDAGVFNGVKLKTQNNFLRKFRKKKKKEHFVEGEEEALASGGDTIANFVMMNIVKK